MEKIILDNKTHIYKGKFEFNKEIQKTLLILCKKIIKHTEKTSHRDAYPYGLKIIENNQKLEINNHIDKLMDFAMKKCIELYTEGNKKYEKIYNGSWINVVRRKNPKQKFITSVDEKNYHTHTKLNANMNDYYPHFTYVFYIQMPNNLKNYDGVLWIQGENNIDHHILPKEGEFVIMNGDLPHAPHTSFNSTKDRIVLAGNIGFESTKKEKSFL